MLTRVAGVSFYQEAVKRIEPSMVATLVREPLNVHDPNAIRVDVNEETIGYIPRHNNSILAKAMDMGILLEGRIEFMGMAGPNMGVTLSLSLKGQDENLSDS